MRKKTSFKNSYFYLKVRSRSRQIFKYFVNVGIISKMSFQSRVLLLKQTNKKIKF